MRPLVYFLLLALLASIAVGPMVHGQVDIQALQAKQDALKQNMAALKQTQENVKVALKATQEKMKTFDKTKATAKEETVSLPGVAKKISYTDENGNILTVYVDASGNTVKSDYYDIATKQTLVEEFDASGNAVLTFTTETGKILTSQVASSGNIAKSDYYDPETKNRLVVEYDAAGKVASEKIVDEAQMQELTVTNTAAGGSTVVFHDITTGDTLTTGYDQPNGEGKIVVPPVYSKTPGLPPGTHWCSNTGKWETTKPVR